jgi:hypothetical protein
MPTKGGPVTFDDVIPISRPRIWVESHMMFLVFLTFLMFLTFFFIIFSRLKSPNTLTAESRVDILTFNQLVFVISLNPLYPL